MEISGVSSRKTAVGSAGLCENRDETLAAGPSIDYPHTLQTILCNYDSHLYIVSTKRNYKDISGHVVDLQRHPNV